MIFRTTKKDYYGADALEVVRAIEADDENYLQSGQSIRQFLRWSLLSLNGSLPHRDTHVSERMKDEELALHYLYLRDEYGLGKLLLNADAQNCNANL